MSDVIYKDESYQIIGACMDVYNELGCGFLEAVYQEALAIEFDVRGIPFVREKDLAIQYKQRQLSTTYRADFVVFDKIILGTKAAESLVSRNESQVLNYLSATKQRLGILVNFGASEGLQSKRFVI